MGRRCLGKCTVFLSYVSPCHLTTWDTTALTFAYVEYVSVTLSQARAANLISNQDVDCCNHLLHVTRDYSFNNLYQDVACCNHALHVTRDYSFNNSYRDIRSVFIFIFKRRKLNCLLYHHCNIGILKCIDSSRHGY